MEKLLRKFGFVKKLIAENEDLKDKLLAETNEKMSTKHMLDAVEKDRDKLSAITCMLIDAPHMMFKTKADKKFVIVEQSDIEKYSNYRVMCDMNFPRTSINVYAEKR